MQSRTFREIIDQPNAWRKLLDDMERRQQDITKYLRLKGSSEVVFMGCGTSHYLALSAANIFSSIAGQRARGVPSSEVFLFPASVFPRADSYLAIAISRSGRTTETLRAAQFVRRSLGIETIALTCDESSELVAVCDRSFVARGATEKSVVMTKSFTSMLLMTVVLAGFMAANDEINGQLPRLPVLARNVLERQSSLVEDIANDATINNFVFLGQGPYYGIACESMLKIKEMSLSTSEAYHVMEYRHGPMALADEYTLVTFFISDKGQVEEEAVLTDVKKLGAKTLVLCESASARIRSAADWVIELNSGLSDFLRALFYVPVCHLLGFHRATAKGLNPDHPRHLTQVVVLEEN